MCLGKTEIKITKSLSTATDLFHTPNNKTKRNAQRDDHDGSAIELYRTRQKADMETGSS